MLSFVMAIAMVICMIPMSSFTARAADPGGGAGQEYSEVLPFNKNNITIGHEYSYEGQYFSVSSTWLPIDENGIACGNRWYILTVTAKDPSIMITKLEAEIGFGGSDFAFIGISGGEKQEKGPV